MIFRTLLALAGSLAAAPAAATYVTATYTGHVGTEAVNFDTTGVFGPANTSLIGDAFTATFRFDRANATSIVEDSTMSDLKGGRFYGGTRPFGSAVLTINGVDFGFSGAFGAEATASDHAINQTVENLSEQLINGFFAYFTFIGFDVVDVPLSPIFGANGSYDTPYFFADEASIYSNLPGHYVEAHAYLNPEHLTIATVPEPAGWAMMVAGFGLVGAMSRRRRETVGATL